MFSARFLQPATVLNAVRLLTIVVASENIRGPMTQFYASMFHGLSCTKLRHLEWYIWIVRFFTTSSTPNSDCSKRIVHCSFLSALRTCGLSVPLSRWLFNCITFSFERFKHFVMASSLFLWPDWICSNRSLHLWLGSFSALKDSVGIVVFSK